MRASYAREKINSAAHALASGTGTIQKRLWDAYMEFHPLQSSDFPDDLKEDWNEIHAALTTEEPTYNEKNEPIVGRVENTLRKMSDEAASELAAKITGLQYSILTYGEK
ncbi:MAG: hypothetical protein J0L80_14430 [Chitinophagales bacterium]|nr:hypothetical protein [Chitinophagales bacterium]